MKIRLKEITPISFKVTSQDKQNLNYFLETVNQQTNRKLNRSELIRASIVYAQKNTFNFIKLINNVDLEGDNL